GSSTTLALFALAMSRVPSHESVSTTRISSTRAPRAFRTSSITLPIDPSSFRVGMTTETLGISRAASRGPAKRFRSRRERLAEQLVSEIAREGGTQPQEGPEARPLLQHPDGPVPAPEGAVLERELFAPRPVPEGLAEEVVRGAACAVVHNRVRPEGDRVARPHGAAVQVE